MITAKRNEINAVVRETVNGPVHLERGAITTINAINVASITVQGPIIRAIYGRISQATTNAIRRKIRP